MALRSRERLNRAEDLLRIAQMHSDDSDLFRASFEAFITFARSVLQVLKKEVDKAGASQRFKAEWDRLREEKLPDFFRTTRNILIHEGAKGDSRTRQVITEAVSFGSIGLEPSARVDVERASSVSESTHAVDVLFPPEQTIRKKSDTAQGSVEHFFSRGPYKDQEVFSVCRQYLVRLHAAITEAEKCGG